MYFLDDFLSVDKMVLDYKLLLFTLGHFHDLFCLCSSLFTFPLFFLSSSIHIHLQSVCDTAYRTSQPKHFSIGLCLLHLYVV